MSCVFVSSFVSAKGSQTFVNQLFAQSRAILEINDCVTIDKAITKQAYSFKRKTRDYLLCFKRKVFTQINSLDQG